MDPEFYPWAYRIVSRNLSPDNWRVLEWEARRASVIEANKLILSGKLQPWQVLSLEVAKRHLVDCALIPGSYPHLEVSL